MAKTKTAFVCTQCGNDSPKWIGKCPVCGEWNTYVEEIITKATPSQSLPELSNFDTFKSKPLLLKEIQTDDEVRLDMNDLELNRVLGGGLVPGSLVLIVGEPGI
jgi:DNA repair protein RadA/Sms